MKSLSPCARVATFTTRFFPRVVRCLRATLVLALFGSTAHAAIFTWDGGDATLNDWSAANNWNPNGAPTQPGTGLDDLHFAGNTRLAPNMEANYNINSILFESGASAFVLTNSAGTTLAIQIGITNADNSLQTVSITDIVLGAAQTWSATTTGGLTVGGDINNGGFLLTISTPSTGDVILSGNLSGTGGLLKIGGTGDLTLSGVNTFSGGVTHFAGTLNINSTTALGATAGTFTIGAGTTINNTSGGAITLANNNAQIWNGSFTFTGGSSLNLGTGAVTMVAASTITVSASTLTVGGVIDDGASPLTLSKVGPGALTLNGANTFKGGVNLAVGTLNIGNASALGSGTVDIIGSSSSLNNTSGSSLTLANAFTLSGNALFIGSSDLRINGAVTISGAATRTITVNANTLTLAGGLGQDIAGRNFIKAGSGTLSLTAASTYTGTTTISGGVLLLNHASALSGGNLSFTDGVLGLGTGDFSRALGTGAGQVQFVTGSGGGWAAYGANRAVNLGGSSALVTWNVGSFVLTGDALILGSSGADSTVDFQNPINLNNGTRTVQVDNGTASVDAVLSGSIANNTGTGDLTKTGNGTLSLTVSNSYNGATAVNAGVVRISNNNALGTTGSGTAVASGAAIEINGNGLVLAEPITSLAGDGGGSGALRNLANNNAWNGDITVADVGARINSDAGLLTLGGLIDETAGALKNLTIGGAGNVAITNTITGGGDLSMVKDGAGTLTLSGTAANTEVSTTVNGGTLVLNKTAGINAVGGALTIGDGTGTDTVRLSANDQIATVAVTVNSSGVLDLNTFSDTIGNLTVNGGGVTTGGGSLSVGTLAMTAGSVATGGGTLTLGGNVTGNAAAASATITGSLALGAASRTFTIDDGAAPEDMAISAVISGGAGIDLTKAGAGTLVLSGNNTYVGATTINAGTVVVGVNAPVSANGALGNASSAVLLGNTATADNASLLIGGASTVSRAITVRSGNTGVMTLGGSADNNSAFTGAIGLQKGVTITQAATTGGNALTISGGISATTAGAKTVTFNNAGDVTVSATAIVDGSGTIAVVKQGGGTLNLNVASTYTGGTTLGAGHLSLGADNVLPNTGLFTFAGGILDANSHTDTIGPLSLTASSTLNLSPGGASGTLTFASMTASASTVWTINGWTGDAGNAGADDQIIISADPGATVLGQIQFTGFEAGALRLGTGEIVPVPEPINIALGVFGAVCVVFGLGHRCYARARCQA